MALIPNLPQFKKAVPITWNIMSTRQPFGISDKPAGLAGRCDWVILEPGIVLGDGNIQPKTIFIALRTPYLHGLLMYFFFNVLPLIKNKFVLITGSGDITLPLQIDKRFNQFTVSESTVINRIKNDDRVICWFAENLSVLVDKMVPIPLGINPNEYNPDLIWEYTRKSKPLRERCQKVLCVHRVHGMGPQMLDRVKVSRLAASKWKTFCISPNVLLPHKTYMEYMTQHQFIFCVHGGGIDPSPKAWEAIASGTIPIIQHSTLDDAYSQLPVAFVDNWDENAVNPNILIKWLDELSPYYEDPVFRKQVVHKLSLDFWWDRIISRTLGQ